MSGEPVTLDLDRRSFMKASALAGAVAIGGATTGQVLGQEEEDPSEGGETPDGALGNTETVNSVCNYCAVGCGFKGERRGNAFVGQEPWSENPINNGSVCAKGASIYGTEHSEKRVKHPLQRVDGEWQRITWEQAYNEITGEIERIWEEYGRDSVYWLGSAHHSNEEAYALRKLIAFMGTNNVDHQARICHSPTVAGLANTWGYGAMTNTINDYRNYDLDIIIGQNPAEAHPIAMQHILEGQKRGGDMIVIEPRFTKTAAHADQFYRLRSGTDTAFMLGLLNYLIEQDALNEEHIEQRVNGWPDLEAELDNYDLETVSDITWISEDGIREVGDLIIENMPNVQIEWAMGGTQHTNGTQNIRAHAITALATGGIGRAGGGLQVMRGHANIQGTTDLGPNAHILPGYYSVSSASTWRYWAHVWSESPYTDGEVSFEDLYEKFDHMPDDLYEEQAGGGDAIIGDPEDTEDDTSMMFQNGLTVSRWYESALDQGDRLLESTLYQPEKTKMAVFWGHSANSLTEMDRMKQAMEELDTLVVVDMFPSVASVMAERDDGVIFLPCASPYEHAGSVTNSHRSVQWKEPVRPPGHNTRPDLEIIQQLADRLGFGEHFNWGPGPELHNGTESYEDVLREINLGVRTIGYQMSPERLQSQQEYDEVFSTEDLEAKAGPHEGEYWQLPWPCWGENPEGDVPDHPGTPIIWRDRMDPREGGHDFRARWGEQAPTLDDWEQVRGEKGYPSEDYPLQETYEQDGEEGLDMLRGTYEPEWWDSEVEGVPQYPGFANTIPRDPTNSGHMAGPVRYALNPERSPYEAAQDFQDVFLGEIDPADYEEYQNSQPDPPTGRGRARAVAWNFYDTVPIHREPVESPREDLVDEWPAFGAQTNLYRLDQNNQEVQQDATQRAHEQGFELVMTTGRQVEHQGGGAETRNNVFTADLQPHMYAEMHPDVADDIGVDGGDLVVVSTTNRGSILVKARVTYRVDEREVFLPYHWGGVFKGKDLSERYPDGLVPLAIGDSVNIITAPGYDSETQMQETKPALVNVKQATESLLNELNMDTHLLNEGFPQDENDLGQQKTYDVRNRSSDSH